MEAFDLTASDDNEATEVLEYEVDDSEPTDEDIHSSTASVEDMDDDCASATGNDSTDIAEYIEFERDSTCRSTVEFDDDRDSDYSVASDSSLKYESGAEEASASDTTMVPPIVVATYQNVGFFMLKKKQSRRCTG
ncbi:hypothetical protein PR003_g15122 [Phytophthora rubi]|uniref:Uncharacterized protein n=1 Tax=Phytophthora rubi TaxID=129364 RepID=A0A6A4F0N8_9STRA|nr:hypothetical protein PR002_g13919 [Phytophthora rubi]KAE9331197.1 hypothetical protein PR003_g15122 [Phytophthora rubi]